MSAFSSTALPPASPLFRGRQAELARLTQICQGEVTAYTVIYGGHQNGKTSLLLQLEADLRTTVSVCRVDFQLIKGAASAPSFAFLAERIAQVLPLAPDARTVTDAPSLLTFLTQTLSRADITRLVLLLDELGALPPATRQALANALRSFFHTRLVQPALAKLQIIFSGGIELYDLVVTEASSLHNICEEIYLEDLREDEAVGLIADGLQSAGVVPDDAADIGQRVYAQVSGHPYLTQRIGGLLAADAWRGVAIGPEEVEHAVRQISEGGNPLLRQIQNDLREHHLEDAARRLLTKSPRYTRLNEDMLRLELIGLAKRDGNRWAPRNPLLAEVFREVLEMSVPAQTPTPARDESAPATPVTPTATQPPPSSAASVTPIPPDPDTATVGEWAMPWLPTLIYIPAGPFLMGSSDADKQADDNEKPQHTLTLPDFWIGKTLVTNAQFRPFVEGDGYRNECYWTQAGWQWCQAEKIVTPEYWDNARWNGNDYPMVGVSWFEAVAYCRWLSAQTGHEFRLPSEAEWEKAARGSDGRIWPWGNTWEDGRCNSKEASVGRTTPVSQYLNGASPYGVLDMAGNVWEWVVTKSKKPYPYQLEDEWAEAYLEADTRRRSRGGSYASERKIVREAYRYGLFNARNRNGGRGLRVSSRSPLPGIKASQRAKPLVPTPLTPAPTNPAPTPLVTPTVTPAAEGEGTGVRATSSPSPATVEVQAMPWLPTLIYIPAGPFLMGSSDADTLAKNEEKLQHTLTLPDYWIAKMPVTHAQFQPFVEGDGYRNQHYWTEIGWQWCQQEKIVTPRYWDKEQWNGADYPVVGVSWFEAVAYCRWLSAQTGHEFRLPSEAEWEKAARGPDGRIWPWGTTWEAGCCNSKEAGISKTTPVGQYLNGASPYGVLDMAGNVCEWCATKHGKSYPYQIEDEWAEAYLEGDIVRKIRGGGYGSNQKTVRGAFRFSNNNARYRVINQGLRVASRSPLPGSDS
ncbi:MAG: SUMF1/EgtB/PvdO family nonheme iron enzyme [Chloroflexales bacterium]